MQHDRSDNRLTQLRALVDRLERLPASRQREWMLQEARARMVDVETGHEPRPMRTLQEASAEPPLEPPGRRGGRDRAIKRPSPQPAPVAAQAPPPPAPAPELEPEAVPEPEAAPSHIAGWGPAAPRTFNDEVLWLGDPPDETAEEDAGGSTENAPWRRGLRG